MTESYQPKKTPINLITGYLGSGKTTTILHLLKNRPVDQKWAILVNEFGSIGIDQEAFEVEEGVQIKPLAGGCVCCTLASKFTPALLRLLHLEKPDRILVELTGLGHPAGIFDALTNPDLARFLDLRATLCLMDPRILNSPRHLGSETFQDQVNMADILVLNKTDLTPPELVEEALHHGANLFPPKQRIVSAVSGNVDFSLLDLVSDGRYQVRFPAYHEDHEPADDTEEVVLTREQPIRQLGSAYGRLSCGWIFHHELVFEQGVFEFLKRLEPIERVKGVFRTAEGWFFFNRIDTEYNLYELSYRRDSRLEIITEADLNWSKIENSILGYAGAVE